MVETGRGVETMGADGSSRDFRHVYIIDDDTDVRQSLHFLLASFSINAWPFAQAADFIEQLPSLKPAPVLTDVRMPHIDGLELLAILKEREVDWPVIVMTAHGDVKIAVRAMKLGAIDFLEKPFQPNMLEIMLERAFDLVDQTDRIVRARNDARDLIAQLSRREREIVLILMNGIANKAAAHKLGLSVRTVEMHRSNALAKLGLKSMAEVMALVTTADLPPRQNS